MQGGFSGAFKGSVITEWLHSNKPSRISWDDLLKTFIQSLASSCVFEFIMGIGDRHGDNIMLQPDGCIFHIDFAYMMGNKTTFAGIKREVQPFTLTPAMVEVMGGRDSKEFAVFKELVTALYLSVRRHHVLLTGVAMSCLSSKMVHLGCIEDVYYMRDSLAPQLDDTQAKRAFEKKIQEALDAKRTVMNDAVHNLVADMKRGK